MIDKADYLNAKKVVDQYESEESERRDRNIELITGELKEYFKTHTPGGFTIEEFIVKSDWTGFPKIFPIDPCMDEEYWDDEADMELEKIGEKYGFKRFGFESSVHPK